MPKYHGHHSSSTFENMKQEEDKHDITFSSFPPYLVHLVCGNQTFVYNIILVQKNHLYDTLFNPKLHLFSHQRVSISPTQHMSMFDR